MNDSFEGPLLTHNHPRMNTSPMNKSLADCVGTLDPETSKTESAIVKDLPTLLKSDPDPPSPHRLSPIRQRTRTRTRTLEMYDAHDGLIAAIGL